MGIKNWAIQKHKSTGKWFLVFSENLISSEMPSPEEICEAAEKAGLSPYSMIGKDAISSYLQKNSDSAEKPIPLALELSPDFDARLIVNSDKTEAKLYIRKAANAEPAVDLQIINRLLQRSNIINLDMQKIKSGISEFINSPSMEFLQIIAEGTPPKRGADKKLVAHFKQIPQHEVVRLADRLKNLELRSADVENPTTDKDYPLSEAETLTTVQKDDLLYELKESDAGEAGSDIYGKTIPGLPGNDPFLLDLRNIVQSHSELRAGVTGLLLIANTERGLKLRIVPYRDAKIRAVVSIDKMEASLIIESGLGAGERLSIMGVKKALNDVGLLDTITDEKITEIIEAARKKSEEAEFVFLQGIPAVAANSYKFEWAANFEEGQNTATVEKDALILTATLSVKGEAGKDVYGKPIDPKNAYPVLLPQYDDSIRFVEEDGKAKFYASVSGELTRFDNKLLISSLKSIHSDIDEKTGDIIFPGNLIITGDVRDGRKIKALGDLTVTGNAEKSLIYSETSVNLNGGINGKGSGTVWAKNTANLHYAENARIFSGSNIKIGNYCFKCLVKTNGSLSLTGSPGVLLGGNIHAAKGCSVKELGAKKTIRTIISFGQDYLIKDEIEVREKEMAENIAELNEIDKKLKSSEPNLNIEELRTRKVKLIKRNSALTIRIFNLKENFETHIPSKIVVSGDVYPGVVLESHGRYFEVMETHHHVFFTFDEKTGQIVCSPLHDE
ncbi:FapA family protein [Treponema pedis]|uniref:FapA family protein n=1 Tax=Treponema pedis TaxID=409322 RepID=UPI000426E647|nr:FapA family protein [Treponema pedis]